MQGKTERMEKNKGIGGNRRWDMKVGKGQRKRKEDTGRKKMGETVTRKEKEQKDTNVGKDGRKWREKERRGKEGKRERERGRGRKGGQVKGGRKEGYNRKVASLG
jgi:hypothetical protein